MITKTLTNHILKEEWKNGSIWEFDFYIKEMFAHCMAYGKNPFEINFIQPILDDEFLNTKLNDNIIDINMYFFEDKNKVQELINSQNKIINNAKLLLQQLHNNPNNLDLDNYYKVQYELSLLMASVSVVFDKLIEFEIEKIAIKHQIPIATLQNFVINSGSVTALNLSNQALLQLYSEFKKEFDAFYNESVELNGNIKELLANHKEKYGWINSGERGKHSWEIVDFVTQLKNLLKITHLEKINVSELVQNDLENIIKININDNISSDLQIELDFLFQKYLKITLGEYYNEKVLEQLSFNEIKSAISGHNTIASKLKFPHKLMYPYKGEIKVLNLTSEDFDIVKSLIKNDTNFSNQISGRPACQGYAEGYVKIVRSVQDLDTFEDGFILVAEKTQPSYVMAMRKAKAIITDIGGITSHAAIVSREFNIPCIVATENATKILVNGDYVAVDATSGTVTKIKKPSIVQ